MKLFHWLVTAPAAVILVIFAVANRETVTLNFWPLPITLKTSVYIVVLLALLAGFLIGELVAWINGHYWRREARRMSRRAEELERRLAALEPAGANTGATSASPGMRSPSPARPVPARQISHN